MHLYMYYHPQRFYPRIVNKSVCKQHTMDPNLSGVVVDMKGWAVWVCALKLCEGIGKYK